MDIFCICADLPLFVKENVPERWWKLYTVNSTTQPRQTPVAGQVLMQAKLPGERLQNVLQPPEMFKKFMSLVPKLRTGVCESGTCTFYYRHQVLVDLLEAWNSGSEVTIVPVNARDIEGQCTSLSSCVISCSSHVNSIF